MNSDILPASEARARANEVSRAEEQARKKIIEDAAQAFKTKLWDNIQERILGASKLGHFQISVSAQLSHGVLYPDEINKILRAVISEIDADLVAAGYRCQSANDFGYHQVVFDISWLGEDAE